MFLVGVSLLHEAVLLGNEAPRHLHPLCTPGQCSFAHQRLVWCARGGTSTMCELLCRRGSCLLTERGSRQHRHRPKRTKFSNMSSAQKANPGCSQKPCSRAFLIYPTPLPTGHSLGTNEATRAPTPKHAAWATSPRGMKGAVILSHRSPGEWAALLKGRVRDLVPPTNMSSGTRDSVEWKRALGGGYGGAVCGAGRGAGGWAVGGAVCAASTDGGAAHAAAGTASEDIAREAAGDATRGYYTPNPQTAMHRTACPISVASFGSHSLVKASPPRASRGAYRAIR